MPFLDEDGVTRLTKDYLDIFAPKEELGEGDGINAGPIYELSAKGHAEQFSTTGKNLLPSVMLNSYTVNGVIFTKNADGSITCNGTATSEAHLVLGSPQLTIGSTYTLSGCPSGGSGTTYRLAWNYHGYDSGSGLTREANSISNIVIEIYKGATVSNLTFYPQLELGSEATEYEPYTGGAPSPSPDYPQEIQVVRGRNLLKLTDRTVRTDAYKDPSNTRTMDGTGVWPSIASNGYVREMVSSYSITDEMVTLTLNSDNKAYGVGFEYPVKPNEQYIISYENISNGYISYGFFTETGATANVGGDVGIGEAITAPSNAAYILVIVKCNIANGTATVKNIQLTLGSAPQPYVPYGHVGMEVQGENLWGGEKMAADAKAAGRTLGEDSNGRYFRQSLTPISTLLGSGFKENTQYTIILAASKGSGGAHLNLRFTYVGGGETQFTIPSATTTKQYVAIVSTAGKTIESITGAQMSGDAYIYYDECGLFEGVHTVDDFEPYYHTTTPIPLPDRGWVAGLPDGTSDILTLDGAGKCEWELPTSDVVLDGSSDENWSSLYTYPSGPSGQTEDSEHLVERLVISGIMPLPQGYPSNSIDSGVLCDKFIASSNDDTNNHIASFHRRVNYNYGSELLFYHEGENSSTWLAFLAQNPVTILYPLATPIHESKGYIEDWPTDIPEGATITIPELDALNVKYFVANDSISQYTDQWYERTKAVDIAQVEDAVVELTENLVDLTTLDPIGGLERVSDGVRIGSLVQESDGYARGGLAEVTAKGHAEQFSTTGKNLLKPFPRTATSKGVTYTMHDDGTITLVGTATGDETFTVTYGELSIPAGTYTASCDSQRNRILQFNFYASDANAITQSIASDTVISPQRYPIILRTTSGITYNDTIHIQLELGSEATEYEPYTGGAPSPSPDYPQEIQVVRGRNLFDIESYPITQGFYIQASSGDSVSDNDLAATLNYVPCEGLQGKTITLNKRPGFSGPGIAFYDSTPRYLSGIANGGATANTPWTFQVPTDAIYMRFSVPKSATDIQLTLGSTPQPYVPYGHIGMEVLSAKNMLDERTLEQGGITVTGNTKGDSRVRTSGFIPVTAGNTYAISALSTFGTVQYAVNTYTAMQNNRYSEIAWAAAPSTFTIPAGVSYVRIAFRIDNGSANVSPSDFYAVQLECGTQATEYEPHILSTTPIPLPQRGWVAGLPDGTADELRLDGAGKVEWEENTDISTKSDTSKYNYWDTPAGYTVSFDPPSQTIKSAKIMCNKLINGQTWENARRISIDTDGRIRVSFETSDGFPAAIPFNYLYPLATPVTEDCGYVDMPDIPSDCTITIPELDAIGIKYFVDNSVTEYGKQIYARAYAELGDAIVELTERVATLEQQ